MPNNLMRSAGGPLLGRPVTANLFTRIPASMETADATASPTPPKEEKMKNDKDKTIAEK